MDLRLRTREVDGVMVVEAGGELELHNAPQLRTELQRLCSTERPRLVVDLSGLTFIDSTGVGVLVGALKRAREHNGTLDLVCPTARVRRIFEITGLMRALPLHNNAEAALQAARNGDSAPNNKSRTTTKGKSSADTKTSDSNDRDESTAQGEKDG